MPPERKEHSLHAPEAAQPIDTTTAESQPSGQTRGDSDALEEAPPSRTVTADEKGLPGGAVTADALPVEASTNEATSAPASPPPAEAEIVSAPPPPPPRILDEAVAPPPPPRIPDAVYAPPPPDPLPPVETQAPDSSADALPPAPPLHSA